MMFEAHRGWLAVACLGTPSDADLAWATGSFRNDEPACQTAGMRARSDLSVD